MRKLKKLVLAAILTASAYASAPPQVAAVDWCALCDQNPMDCVYCCICTGGTPTACARYCG